MDMHESSTQAPSAAAAVPESLEAVRDILFGAQMRSVETRLQAMEERLLREQGQLRADLVRKIDDLESRARDEFKATSERLAADRARSSEETRSVGAELTQAFRDLEQRLMRLQEATSLADAEIRDQLLMHASATSAEFSRTRETLSADMAGKHQELMGRKTDRNALAGLLDAMARQLGDPTPEAVADGNRVNQPTVDQDSGANADDHTGDNASHNAGHHAGIDTGRDHDAQG